MKRKAKIEVPIKNCLNIFVPCPKAHSVAFIILINHIRVYILRGKKL